MTPILAVRDLSKSYTTREAALLPWTGRRLRLRALDSVSVDVGQGEALAIVGESGCGKSTFARCMVGLEEPDAGTIAFDGERLASHRSLAERRRIQIVFQDPSSSLNPSMSAGAALMEVLRVHRIVPPRRARDEAIALLARVGLSADVATALPRNLSGGQKQRVGIARALAVEPQLLIADEPVSALDVSVQATVLNLLADLRRELGLTLLLISHDLSIVRHVCDRVAVMYLGRIVEVAPTDELFANPLHPYTRRLLAAAPKLQRRKIDAPSDDADEPPSPFELPSGCRYRTRCPFRREVCAIEEPHLEPRPQHRSRHVACHVE